MKNETGLTWLLVRTLLRDRYEEPSGEVRSEHLLQCVNEDIVDDKVLRFD